MSGCRLCPRCCGARREEAPGLCGAPAEACLARADLHFGEEPFLVGNGGAGAVFFSACPLHCVFCQNYEISQKGRGRTVKEAQLAKIFLDLQERGAACLDLVSGTPYLPQILRALKSARKQGLELTVCWNSSAYERPEVLRALAPYVDVWLPDFKYLLPQSAARYSAAEDYPPVAESAIREMLRLSGTLLWDEEGMLRRGVWVRHLALPAMVLESKLLLHRLAKLGEGKIGLSLMRQYRPLYRASDFPELNRLLSDAEYLSLLHEARRLPFARILGQAASTAAAETPAFDFTGLPENPCPNK